MKTTTLIILLAVVGIGFGSDEKLRNEASFDRDESVSLLSSLSTRQRKHVKKELLNLLGLDHTPRPVTGRDETEASASKYMLTLYRSLLDGEDHDAEEATPLVLRTRRHDVGRMTSRTIEKQLEAADTVTSFINKVSGDRLKLKNSLSIECHFDLSQVSPADVVTGAVLRIYKSSKKRKTLIEKFRVEVHRLPVNDSLTSVPERTLQQRITILSNRNGWIDINVTPLVSEWIQSPTNNEGLKISIFNHKGGMVDPALVGIVRDDGPADKQVFLLAFFKSSSDERTQEPVRRKRSADGNRRTGKRQQQQDTSLMNDDHQIYRSTTYKHDRKCQLRTLKVSFKDLKWQDWIIAPEGYGAHYCDGDCVSPLHAHNATNHAIVQTMAYLMNPTSVPKPCCAPTKLSGLSVLYFDDNSNVILKKYRNMVVKSCGCH